LRVYRAGQPLLAEQDFRLPPGDSLIAFAAPVPSGDSVCWERAYTPLLPRPIPPLYRLESVPVYRRGLQDTAPAAFLASGPEGGDSAGGKYRLNYSGSKSMAVTVGSGGGLGLDASLFLNLDGQVAEDVFVEGQLSDQNVPIQPEGNTATLKEVDTKFMRVYGKRYAFTLGDYMLAYGRAGEDRFLAKVQGVDGRYARGGYEAHGSWSVSQGQYQSDTLRGLDGKQRGYYLRGRDGRSFITVLAGTERVWRNGVPLKRGTDYTIDYSEGRLDFLPPLVVTGENLFAAEYQYTEQDFPRTLAAGELRDTAGAFTWSLRAIDESEDEQNPFGTRPDSALARRFRGLGDSIYADPLTGRPVAMPHRQSSSALDLGLKLPGYDGHAALLFSRLDKNLYSPERDDDNLGYSTRYLGTHAIGRPFDRGGLGRTELTLDHESRSRNYEPFKQLIEPRGFLETWNLDAGVAQRGFLADRILLVEKPFTALALGGELGRAEADSAADATGPRASDGSLSRRGGLSARLGGERLYFEAASEAKLARSPDRRDNYKQTAGAGLDAAGLMPSFRIARDEWITALPSGATARSEKQAPVFALATAPIAERLTLNTGLSLLLQRSDFDGRLGGLRDSVRDWGFEEKAVLLGWGPWTSDVFYSFREHRLWRTDAAGAWSALPEESRFNQVEWNNHLAEGRRGYSLISSYRVSQTAEFPLVEDYRFLEGRGDYIRVDSSTYKKVETGGDYVLVGLMRDTTVGSRPYQDLSFSANLDLTPARFPFAVTGVLSDIEFGLDLAFDAQDTSEHPALLPLVTDGQLDGARSGRARYAPALHWKAPGGGRAANLEVDRTYGRAAGIYAYRERLWTQRADFRSEAGPDWEWYLEQAYENRDRGTGSASTSRTLTRNQTYGARLTRKLPKNFQAEVRSQYLRIDGSGSGGATELQGVKPAVKLEKTSLFNGRAFVEYGLIYFWGLGEGGYYATGDFGKGLTHRFEANADFQVGANLYLHFDYVARLEPRGVRLVQKMSAEARAVF
jgi:hypothetical protein